MQDGLSQEQISLVLRRAAELDRALGPGLEEGLDPAAVEQAAVEAGLSRDAVRRAMAELRAGVLDQPAPRRRHRALLGPPSLSVSRAVPREPAAVEQHLHRFLREELFELRRDLGCRTTWVRRRGLEATARRAIDRAVQRRLILREVNHVDLSVVDQGDGWVLVHLDVDVLAARHTQGSIAGSATVAGGGMAATTALVAPDPVFLAAAAIGAGVVGAGAWVGSSVYRRRVGEIESGLAGVLDRIEHGRSRRISGRH